MRHTALICLLGLAGCGWNQLPHNQYTYLNEQLWNPDNVVAATDGLYVPLTLSGKLVRIDTDTGEYDIVDTGAGFVDRLALSPDGGTVVAFLRYTSCVSEEPGDMRGVRRAQDCPPYRQRVRSEVATLSDGAIQRSVSVGTHYNEVRFSADGRWAIAYLDFDAEVQLTGVVDLTSVLVLDLQQAASTPVSVGFAADNVLFSQDATRAVVLSKDSVAVIDLSGAQPTRGTTFPLTLDADQSVTPVGAALTPDGNYALITAAGKDDLFALRLSSPSVNLINLSGTPSAMAVIADDDPQDDIYDDRTIVVHQNRKVVDLIDHESFDVETYALDERMDHIEVVDRMALLWGSQSQHDVYAFDLDDNTPIEFRLENPAVSLHASPTGDFAVALTRAEGGLGQDIEGLYDRSPGMEILDLTDRRGRTSPFLLEGQGIGLAFSASLGRLDALVLQENIDYLYQLDLISLKSTEVDLLAPPLTIGSLPSEGFYITHDAPLGMVTFYNPVTGEQVEAAGFAALGMLDGSPLEIIEEEQ